MQQMHWSWYDLTGEEGGAPIYVRRFCSDFLSIKARVKNAAMERAKRQQQG